MKFSQDRERLNSFFAADIYIFPIRQNFTVRIYLRVNFFWRPPQPSQKVVDRTRLTNYQLKIFNSLTSVTSTDVHLPPHIHIVEYPSKKGAENYCGGVKNFSSLFTTKGHENEDTERIV